MLYCLYISTVCHEHSFSDSALYFRFSDEDQSGLVPLSGQLEKYSDEDLASVLLMLLQFGPDAMMRMILRKAYVMTFLFII